MYTYSYLYLYKSICMEHFTAICREASLVCQTFLSVTECTSSLLSASFPPLPPSLSLPFLSLSLSPSPLPPLPPSLYPFLTPSIPPSLHSWNVVNVGKQKTRKQNLSFTPEGKGCFGLLFSMFSPIDLYDRSECPLSVLLSLSPFLPPSFPLPLYFFFILSVGFMGSGWKRLDCDLEYIFTNSIGQGRRCRICDLDLMYTGCRWSGLMRLVCDLLVALLVFGNPFSGFLFANGPMQWTVVVYTWLTVSARSIRHVTYESALSHMNGHVTHKWFISRINESTHIWMSRVTYEEVMSRVTYEWVVSHINESYHTWMRQVTRQWVMLHFASYQHVFIS